MNGAVPMLAIDGPSGAGKGTVCQQLAARLGWPLLDSGAIYRVLALAALHHDVALDDEAALDTTDLRFVVAVRDQAHLEAALRNLRRTQAVIRANRITPQAM